MLFKSRELFFSKPKSHKHTRSKIKEFKLVDVNWHRHEVNEDEELMK